MTLQHCSEKLLWHQLPTKLWGLPNAQGNLMDKHISWELPVLALALTGGCASVLSP